MPLQLSPLHPYPTQPHTNTNTMADEEPRIEPLPADEDEEVAGEEGGEEGDGKQSRGEKKARKALSKLGLKPEAGISRVTIRKSKNVLFVVKKPEVMKSPGSDTYIVFGDAHIEDLSQNAMAKASAAAAAARPEESAALATAADATPAVAEEAGDDEEVDETGVEEKDIQLVMAQSNKSRAVVVRTLKKHNNDVVNSIMDLTD